MTNRHLMETQNLVISFDYSWFLAKNLAYAECRIMKFHYRNSSTSPNIWTTLTNLWWHTKKQQLKKILLLLDFFKDQKTSFTQLLGVEKEMNTWTVTNTKLYIPSTLNKYYLLWHTQLILSIFYTDFFENNNFIQILS